ncbi:MAG: hypothetical protein GEV12_19850 [Micromonosporaceae bacterium]|nr:hypothetical protein [Micromonosporaceae bacterium]
MVVCAGVFTLVYLGADARVPALAVARPLSAGQTVVDADLRVVRIVPDAGLELLPADQASQVVGRAVRVPLAEGTLLAGSHLGPVGWPPQGQAVAAVPIKPGRMPAGITEGSRVLVVPVAPDATVEPATAPEASGPGQPVPATVVGVVDAADGSGTSVVTLLLDQGAAVAVAGAGGDLALVLAGG